MSDRRQVHSYIDTDGREVIWDQPPASVAEARAEWLRLSQDVKDIAVQLDVDRELPGQREDHAWRKRAMWAKRGKERRAAFLAMWLEDQERLPAELDAAQALATISRTLGVLLGVRDAAARFVDDDSDAAYASLVKAVDDAREAA